MCSRSKRDGSIQRTGVHGEFGDVINVNSNGCDGMWFLAAATKWTGDATVLPAAGEHTVTPVVVAVQPLDEAPNISAISAELAAIPG